MHLCLVLGGSLHNIMAVSGLGFIVFGGFTAFYSIALGMMFMRKRAMVSG